MKQKTGIDETLMGLGEGDSGEDVAGIIAIDGVVELDLDKGTLTLPTPDNIGIQIKGESLSQLPDHVQRDLAEFIALKAAKASRSNN